VGSRKRGGVRQKPKTITAELLAKKALSYLERFDSSEQNLRRVLLRYVDSIARAPEAAVNREEATVLVDALVGRYVASGLVDDARLSASVAQGQRVRGASRRAIEHKLRSRGVPAAVAEAALDGLDADAAGDPELAAAQALVRRRRLGPYRPEGERAARRQRDLGALARAGFSLDVAVRALGLGAGEADGEI
jgi:regulatory protein